MENTRYKQMRLIIFLAIAHYSTLHSSYQYIQKDWHKALVHLYYKGSRQNNKKDVKPTIQIFKQACQNITNAQSINKENIKARQLNKAQFSKKGYDLEVLKVYYLFCKIDKNEKLTPEEQNVGEKAITKLYNKNSQGDTEKNFKTIIVSIEDTKNDDQLLNSKRKLNYKDCATFLAVQFNAYQKNQNAVNRTTSSESRESNRSNNNIASEENEEDTIQLFSSADLQSGNEGMHLHLNGSNKNITTNPPVLTENLLKSQQRHLTATNQLSIPLLDTSNQGGLSIDSNMSESPANSDTENEVEHFSEYFHKNKKLSSADSETLKNLKEKTVTMNKKIKKLNKEKSMLNNVIDTANGADSLFLSANDRKRLESQLSLKTSKIQQREQQIGFLQNQLNWGNQTLQQLNIQLQQKDKTIQDLQQQLDKLDSQQKPHNPIIYIICFAGGIFVSIASKKLTRKTQKDDWQDQEQDLLSESNLKDTLDEPLPKKTKRKRN